MLYIIYKYYITQYGRNAKREMQSLVLPYTKKLLDKRKMLLYYK